MATTFRTAVNEVLSELNEVKLTAVNFANATNIQNAVKQFVNRAYFDINAPVYKWPWLSASTSTTALYGNTYISTSAGQRWYLLNASSTNVNDDYGSVDWDRMFLTTNGVVGASTPYTNANLCYVPIEKWKDFHIEGEADDAFSSSPQYGVPKYVLRNPDNRRLGLSPIPDKEYRVYFYAFTRPVALVNEGDEFVLPDQYITVLISRARYYAWQRKENPQQAALALEDWKQGIRAMRQQEMQAAPDYITDDRIRFV
jgi:hypothetical protein